MKNLQRPRSLSLNEYFQGAPRLAPSTASPLTPATPQTRRFFAHHIGVVYELCPCYTEFPELSGSVRRLAHCISSGKRVFFCFVLFLIELNTSTKFFVKTKEFLLDLWLKNVITPLGICMLQSGQAASSILGLRGLYLPTVMWPAGVSPPHPDPKVISCLLQVLYVFT